MSYYSGMIEALGLKEWCSAGKDANTEESFSLSDLLTQTTGETVEKPWWEIPFPSLDNLHTSCDAISRTTDLTNGLERMFLDVKQYLQLVLDPLTQPLSWLLDGTLFVLTSAPWWVLIPILLLIVYKVTRSTGITIFVAFSLLLMAFIDHYSYAVETLAVIFVCTVISVIIGVPIGITMSKYNKFQRSMIPLLDMLQTLPPFVYLIPLIFLFSVTESKLYGIAIILYAVVPVVRLTDLGIRLVDQDIIEAADAFGMSAKQKLFRVEIPLALPNIMAGVNQTIMMALAMVVIASLVSAPGLGVLVLRGIRNLELGVGLVSGAAIVLIAVILDRVTKKSLERINASQAQNQGH